MGTSYYWEFLCVGGAKGEGMEHKKVNFLNLSPLKPLQNPVFTHFVA